MNANRFDALVASRELRPLLPILYIAWVDEELGPRECERIRELAAALPALEDEGRVVLDAWLDPGRPPSATDLARLRRVIRERMGRGHRSLAAMAGDAADGDAAGGAGVALADAVAAYERERGIHGAGAAAEIFRDTGRPVRQDFGPREASFDPRALQRILEGEHAAEWALVREILSGDAFLYDYGESMREQRDAVNRWMAILAERGLGARAMPASIGGADDMPGFIHLFQALAMFDLSLVVKFGVQFGLFGGSILFLGTRKHHERYLADVASLALPGGFAMTESGHGSNVRDLETTAVYDPAAGEFVIDTPTLSARKEWIGNAAEDGRTMTVFAQLETLGERYGVHAFLVPVRSADGAALPGVRIEDCGHKMGLNGVDNGRLYFDAVRVPRENLLDRYGSVAADGTYDSPIAGEGRRFFTMLGTLVGGRISVAAASVTAARKALAIAIRYGVLRRQFGGDDGPETRILDYTTHQLRLFPALAHNVALHFAIEDLVRRFDARTEETSREVETIAAGLKAKASWHAIHAAQMARECCGGSGFLSANQICTIRRDIDVFATFEGDNTVLMQLLAKNRLASYAKGFEQDLVMTVIRELTEKAKTELLEGNPIIARRTDPEHLRDVEFHLDVLRLRAHNLLVSAARRIRKRIEDGMEPFAASNEVQDHLLAYAEAEVESHVAERFAEAVASLPEGPERDALERLRRLSAIDAIYSESTWYLANGYFEPRKWGALREERLALLAEVRPDALAYVDAFGIPDAILSAPIAFEDYIGREPLKAESE